MKLLFATGRPFFPDLFGGAERSMHGALTGLLGCGHQCEGLATHGQFLGRSLLTLKRSLSQSRIYSTCDLKAGFPMWRTRSWMLHQAFTERLRIYKPEIVFTQLSSAGKLAEWSLQAGIRPFIFIRDMADVPFDRTTTENKEIRFIANSVSTASWANEKFSINASVVYPSVDVSKFKVASNPEYITFINPVKEKGVDLAILIAKCLPNLKFLFVESWPLDREQMNYLSAQIRDTKNIVFWRRRMNVQSIYDVTKLLIVPSLWQEAFGRVIIEAQACGIPVIGRDIGGIPEAIGRGGFTLSEHAGADEWSRTIESVIENKTMMNELSRSAISNAKQGDWSPEKVLSILNSLIEEP